ncbi:hypothetical protein SAMN05216506_10247 [Saccharopolyspora kobensis]|uniref:Uncharacterized protein n=1 Tax=Saccharopolyspora kobensis TaxID=146035 RepID=A0ABY1DT70_9PSEU|nr:hypothetical protein SAMN05216506_10247 [Saccharopolyspora kobensis]
MSAERCWNTVAHSRRPSTDELQQTARNGCLSWRIPAGGQQRLRKPAQPPERTGATNSPTSAPAHPRPNVSSTPASGHSEEIDSLPYPTTEIDSASCPDHQERLDVMPRPPRSARRRAPTTKSGSMSCPDRQERLGVVPRPPRAARCRALIAKSGSVSCPDHHRARSAGLVRLPRRTNPVLSTLRRPRCAGTSGGASPSPAGCSTQFQWKFTLRFQLKLPPWRRVGRSTRRRGVEFGAISIEIGRLISIEIA